MKRLIYLFAIILLPVISFAQNIGDKISNISGESPDGQTISLYDLKGKVVLVDFWASWCPPCRGENPNIVSAYNEFKDTEFSKGSGFTVFQISLDSKKADWTKAIEKDHLEWPNHICDFKGWYSPLADEFGIESIPANFLIDQNGVVIAKDLRGNSLELTLKAIKK